MTLPPVLHASQAELIAERDPQAEEDVHFTGHVARTVIEALSAPGDLVLDPFAGFGTTLEAARTMGRSAVGIELLPERVAAIRTRVPGARICEGDARGLRTLIRTGIVGIEDGSVALCLTSPPYMTVNDHPANPLTGYELDGGDYAGYLGSLTEIAHQLLPSLRLGGYLVLNVADISFRGVTTSLIADVTSALDLGLGGAVRHIASVPIEWDALPHDLTADALLVWQRRL